MCAVVVALLCSACLLCGARSEDCLPTGLYTDRTGLRITISPAEHRGLSAYVDAGVGSWRWGNGTLDAEGSLWCGCGAGGSCKSSSGLCRRLTMNFYDDAHSLVRTATATVERDCSGIASWSDGSAAWWKPDETVSQVHIVHMLHLDVGFTNSTRGVCDTYFNDYFPRALETAEELRRRKSPARYQWTSFPWIVQEFLDGAAGCATRRRTPQEIAGTFVLLYQSSQVLSSFALLVQKCKSGAAGCATRRRTPQEIAGTQFICCTRTKKGANTDAGGRSASKRH